MFPFIHVGSLNIGTYGLCILIGAVAGIGVALIRAKRRNFPVEDTLFLSFFALIGVGVGAKILYLITILPDLIEHFQEIFYQPGGDQFAVHQWLCVYGRLIGAVLAMWWYTHHFKMDFWQSVELLIPSVPLVHAFGRIGCFCGGCCYGIPFDPPIGIAFTNSPVAPNGIPLFPVQLVEAGLNFLLFFFLLWFARKPRPQGRILGAYVIAYAVIRFVLEFLRYDYERGILWAFSTSQWISLILLPIGIWLLARRAKAGEKTGFGGASRGRRSRGKRISKAASRSALVPPQPHSLGPQKKAGSPFYTEKHLSSWSPQGR